MLPKPQRADERLLSAFFFFPEAGRHLAAIYLWSPLHRTCAGKATCPRPARRCRRPPPATFPLPTTDARPSGTETSPQQSRTVPRGSGPPVCRHRPRSCAEAKRGFLVRFLPAVTSINLAHFLLLVCGLFATRNTSIEDKSFLQNYSY